MEKILNLTDFLKLPELASKHGKDVDSLIVYIHWLMIALFAGWIVYFFYAIFRFHHTRNPKADYVGVKSHASSYVEIAVAVVEGVILIFLAIPLWARAVDEFPAEKDSVVVQIVAQQFGWNVRYAGKDGIPGKQDMKFVKADNVFGIDPADPNGLQEAVEMVGQESRFVAPAGGAAALHLDGGAPDLDPVVSGIEQLDAQSAGGGLG